MRRKLLLGLLTVSMFLLVGCKENENLNGQSSTFKKEIDEENFKIEFEDGNLYDYDETIKEDKILINSNFVLVDHIKKEDFKSFREEFTVKHKGRKFIHSKYINDDKVFDYNRYSFMVDSKGNIYEDVEEDDLDIFEYYNPKKEKIDKIDLDTINNLKENFKEIGLDKSLENNLIYFNPLKGSDNKYTLLRVSNIYGNQIGIVDNTNGKTYLSDYIKNRSSIDNKEIKNGFLYNEKIYYIDKGNNFYKSSLDKNLKFEKIDINLEYYDLIQNKKDIYFINKKEEVFKFEDDNIKKIDNPLKKLIRHSFDDYLVYEEDLKDKRFIYICKPSKNKIDIIKKMQLNPNDSIVNYYGNRIVIKSYNRKDKKVVYKFYDLEV